MSSPFASGNRTALVTMTGVPSTPGTNRKNLVVMKSALPTPSFSQQFASASKRKRDGEEELDDYPSQLRNSKATVMRVPLDVYEEQIDQQWLLRSGDLLVGQGQRLRLHPHILSPLGNTNTATLAKSGTTPHVNVAVTLPVLTIDSPLALSEVSLVDVLLDSRVLVLATVSGAFAFWTLPDMNNLSGSSITVRNNVATIDRPQILTFQLEMLDNDEEVRHIRTQGNNTQHIISLSCSLYIYSFETLLS